MLRVAATALAAIGLAYTAGIGVAAEAPSTEPKAETISDRLECDTELITVVTPEYAPGAHGEATPQRALDAYLSAMSFKLTGSYDRSVESSAEGRVVDSTDNTTGGGRVEATALAAEDGAGGYLVDSFTYCAGAVANDGKGTE